MIEAQIVRHRRAPVGRQQLDPQAGIRACGHDLGNHPGDETSKIEQGAAGAIADRNPSAIEAHARADPCWRLLAHRQERTARGRCATGGDEGDPDGRIAGREPTHDLGDETKHELWLIGGGRRNQNLESVRPARDQIGEIMR